MKFRIERGGWTFYIGVNRTELVDGYNSNLPDGNHFLMWDFDEIELVPLKFALAVLQRVCELPPIYILASGKPDCYHANCFKSLPWSEVTSIIARTPYVDKKYLAIGILRGFFTLRYSPAGGKDVELVDVLPSVIPEDVDPMSLESFSTYPKKRR